MTKIAEFLTHFDDQHLANLQCAAEDGHLVFQDSCNCLLHHFAGEYSVTKWEGETGALARAAEHEFLELGKHERHTTTFGPGGQIVTVLFGTKEGDSDRRRAILPMIHAEWARRAARPVDIIQTGSVTFEWTEEEAIKLSQPRQPR